MQVFEKFDPILVAGFNAPWGLGNCAHSGIYIDRRMYFSHRKLAASQWPVSANADIAEKFYLPEETNHECTHYCQHGQHGH